MSHEESVGSTVSDNARRGFLEHKGEPRDDIIWSGRLFWNLVRGHQYPFARGDAYSIVLSNWHAKGRKTGVEE